MIVSGLKTVHVLYEINRSILDDVFFVKTRVGPRRIQQLHYSRAVGLQITKRTPKQMEIIAQSSTFRSFSTGNENELDPTAHGDLCHLHGQHHLAIGRR